MGDVDKAYKLKGNSDYEPEHFSQTAEEAERLFNEMNRYASGSVILTEGTPAVYGEDGEIGSRSSRPCLLHPNN